MQNNTRFEEFDHPRWGIIQCLVSSRDIIKAEELYAYYGYQDMSFPLDFPWYFELKRTVEKQLRLGNQHKGSR